jgi:hypothetical protein
VQGRGRPDSDGVDYYDDDYDGAVDLCIYIYIHIYYIYAYI